jgi:hypothetical protein
MRKGNIKKNVGDLMAIPVGYPFEIMGADIIGPLPVSNNGHRYILTFTDHFTKWVEAFALKKKKLMN